MWIADGVPWKSSLRIICRWFRLQQAFSPGALVAVRVSGFCRRCRSVCLSVQKTSEKLVRGTSIRKHYNIQEYVGHCTRGWKNTRSMRHYRLPVAATCYRREAGGLTIRRDCVCVYSCSVLPRETLPTEDTMNKKRWLKNCHLKVVFKTSFWLNSANHILRVFWKIVFQNSYPHFRFSTRLFKFKFIISYLISFQSTLH